MLMDNGRTRHTPTTKREPASPDPIEQQQARMAGKMAHNASWAEAHQGPAAGGGSILQFAAGTNERNFWAMHEFYDVDDSLASSLWELPDRTLSGLEPAPSLAATDCQERAGRAEQKEKQDRLTDASQASSRVASPLPAPLSAVDIDEVSGTQARKRVAQYDLNAVDDRTKRRLLKNRASAERSRLQRKARMQQLEEQVVRQAGEMSWLRAHVDQLHSALSRIDPRHPAILAPTTPSPFSALRQQAASADVNMSIT